MPSNTFFNLPVEKKERIIAAAQKEFAENCFNDASIASIIKKADIPRGSFYQYFNNLKDLYKYLLELIAEKKLSFFNELMAKMDMDKVETIDLIKNLYRMGIKFARDNPEFAEIANNLYKEDQQLKDEIYAGFEEKSGDLYRNLIKRGKKRGDIREDIDTEVLSLMLYSLNIQIGDHFLKKINMKDFTEEEFSEYLAVVDKMLGIIENG
ncbi:MAG: TetR/AcrR family transcriptional regulator, partial [Halanaerobiaceae bacterium]